MREEREGPWVAFAGERRIAAGTRAEVARAVKEVVDGGEADPVMVFDEASGRPVELGLLVAMEESGGAGADLEQPRRGPGRPKLGVVGREVTLLPRHWAWLASQRSSASVTLRKLVDQARRDSADADRVRHAQDSTYGFMQALMGDYPGYEEATRALYAGDRDGFAKQTESWPKDLRDQARKMAEGAFDATPSEAVQ